MSFVLYRQPVIPANVTVPMPFLTIVSISFIIAYLERICTFPKKGIYAKFYTIRQVFFIGIYFKRYITIRRY